MNLKNWSDTYMTDIDVGLEMSKLYFGYKDAYEANSEEDRTKNIDKFLEDQDFLSRLHLELLTKSILMAKDNEKAEIFKMLRYPNSYCLYMLFVHNNESNKGAILKEMEMCRKWAQKEYPGCTNDTELEHMLTIGRNIEWATMECK